MVLVTPQLKQKEVREIYFDAVMESERVVLFNGTPEETREWLLNAEFDGQESNITVWDGRTLNRWTVAEYLNR